MTSDKHIKLENTYITLPDIFYSKQYPDKVPLPEIVIFNKSLADSLGIDKSFFNNNNEADILSGNEVMEGTYPIAQAYAGHQFGYFTMLGDGRAVLLGEYISKNGKRFDIQLKGSGVTPYSRGGDGKAVLGPMLREYIISEAMNALGINTTRSLAVTKTGEYVMREEEHSGAVLTRIASSHIRVGTFEYAANFGTIEDIKALADYTIKRHFKTCEYNDNPYIHLLKEVIKNQAELIAKWQLVGFIHGVMNTDNVSICGETIDYGPCAFMDEYDPSTVFSSIDRNGRYAYGNQPKIGLWNMARFAESLLPLLHENMDEAVKIAEKSLEEYNKLYFDNWYNGMKKKLGLFNEEDNDKNLIDNLLNMMRIYKEDYTNTFYYLTCDNVENLKMSKKEDFKVWYKSWKERIHRQDKSDKEIIHRQDKSDKEIRKLMVSSNPAVIPRNHRVEEALKAAVEDNDYSVMNSLLKVLLAPYDYSNVNEFYTRLPEPAACKYKTYCGT